MGEKNHGNLTEPQNLWKIILLVCIAVIGEGIMLWAATSGKGFNWDPRNTSIAPRNKTVEEVVPEPEKNTAEEINLPKENTETTN